MFVRVYEITGCDGLKFEREDEEDPGRRYFVDLMDSGNRFSSNKGFSSVFSTVLYFFFVIERVNLN